MVWGLQDGLTPLNCPIQRPILGSLGMSFGVTADVEDFIKKNGIFECGKWGSIKPPRTGRLVGKGTQSAGSLVGQDVSIGGDLEDAYLL